MMDGKISLNGCSILLLFLILTTPTIKFSHAADTLLPSQSIRDGQTLISKGQTFELGFFSPGNSSNRYVGIWYHKLPIQTVVWVANRERPVLDSSGFITIDEEGNLIILDKIGTSITLASNTGRSNLTSATLLDSGNLVLRELNDSGDGQVLWQSFDNPTDTFLPGMKLGMNGKQNRLITSWQNSEDPAPGDFSMGIDPNGTKQFFIWQRGEVYWSSGIWNGQNFSLVMEMTPTYYDKFSYVPDWNGSYYSYSLRDTSIISRGVMDILGQIKQLTWIEDAQEWVVFFVQPKRFLCEVPSNCGANGLCNNNTSPTCKCLSGFQPSSIQQWESSDWSGGCVRELQMQCGNDGFLKLANVKLPIFFSNSGNSSLGLEDCKARCSRNCSCSAYASAHVNGTGCLLWFGELMGLQENYNGIPDIYVRVAASFLNQASDHGRKRVLWIAISVVSVVVIVFLAGAILLCYLRWRKIKRKKKSQEQSLFEIGSNTSFSNLSAETIKHGKGEKGPDCSLFSFTTIAAATNNFAASDKLGEGGFGPVYKGMLEGRAIAVKRLSKSSGQGLTEFKNEITLIANLQHTNLVRLLGYCIQQEEKLLIYEYMPNKSLDSYIFDPIKGAQLDWHMRLNIIEGIAQGLLYLHKYSRLRVIHRDLKASNVLLDNEMNPKISDFGMARIFGQNETQANTRRVVGTYGYMSPEYAMEGLFSIKSDVYSFGVLLLEIVSGKKNSAFHHFGNSPNLLGYAWELWKEGRGLKLLDPLVEELQPSHEVLRCIHVALLCVQDSTTERPTMSDVIYMLSNEMASLPTPKQPVFSITRTTIEIDLPSNRMETCSLNNVTFSSMEGR